VVVIHRKRIPSATRDGHPENVPLILLGPRKSTGYVEISLVPITSDIKSDICGENTCEFAIEFLTIVSTVVNPAIGFDIVEGTKESESLGQQSAEAKAHPLAVKTP
jgi:hypothetical protein